MNREIFKLKASVIISASNVSGNEKLDAIMDLHDKILALNQPPQLEGLQEPDGYIYNYIFYPAEKFKEFSKGKTFSDENKAQPVYFAPVAKQEQVVTDEMIDEAADKYAFRVPYDGSNKFYDDEALKHFISGAKWLRSQQGDGWIDATKQLPEKGERVLCNTIYGIQIGWLTVNGDWKFTNEGNQFSLQHWMPLPQLPAAPQQTKQEETR